MGKVNKLGQYKGIEVKVEKKSVTDEELAQQLQMFVMQNPTLVEKEGTVDNGDITTIDFEGFKDGVPFDGGKAEGHQLEIGSGQFIPGFEDQMVGMAKGETKDLTLTFPENYGAADLAGQEVVFKVTVHKIENKKDSELNDEFVASLNFPEINTVEDLKNGMRSQIQSQYDQSYRSEVENAIFDTLIKDSEVEADEENIQKAIDIQLQHMSMQLASQGMELDQYLQMIGSNNETFMEQLKPTATQQAQFELIIDEIINLENIVTSDEEADEQLDLIAKQNNLTKEQVLEQVELEKIKNDFNRVKASQLVIQSAIIA